MFPSSSVDAVVAANRWESRAVAKLQSVYLPCGMYRAFSDIGVCQSSAGTPKPDDDDDM